MSPTLVMWIVNILLIVSAVIGLLLGLKRGLKKAGVRFITFMAFLVIAGVLTPIVSSAILQIKLELGGEVVTIEQYMLNTISTSVPEFAGLFEASPSLQQLISKFPLLIANLIVFMLLIFLIGLIGYFIFCIISNIFFKKQKLAKKPEYSLENNKPVMIKDTSKRKKYRLLGGLIGAVQGAVLIFAFLLPLTGIVGFVNDTASATIGVSADTEETNEELTPIAKLIKNYIPEEYMEYLKAYDQSVVAVVGGVGDLDNMCFDAISSIKVNGEKITLRKEANSLVSIYNDVYSVVDMVNDGTFSGISSIRDIDFAKIKKAVNTLFGIGTIRSVAPELIPWAIREFAKVDDSFVYKDEFDIVIADILDYIESEPDIMDVLKSDLLSVVNMAELFVTTGLIDEVENVTEFNLETVDNVLGVLKEEIVNSLETYSNAKAFIDNIFSSKTLNRLLADAVNVGLSVLEKTIQPLTSTPSVALNVGRVKTDEVNWSNVSNAALVFFKNAVGIYDSVKTIDFDNISSEIDSLFEIDYETVINNACSMLSTIVNTPILEASDDDIYNNIMLALNKTEYAKYVDFSKTSANNFWSNIGTPLVNTLDIAKEVYKVVDEGTPIVEFDANNTRKVNVDFDKIEQALEGIFNDGIATCIKSDILDLVKPMVLESVKDTEFETLVTNVFDNLTEGGNLSAISNDVMALFDVAKEVVLTGVVDDFKADKLQDKENIYKLIGRFQEKISNEEGALTRIQSILGSLNSTKTLRYILVDAINIGIDAFEKNNVGSFDFELSTGRASYNTDWTKMRTSLLAIGDNLSKIKIKNVADRITLFNFELPVDIDSTILYVGNILNELAGLPLFDYLDKDDNEKNIFKDIMVALNTTEFSEFIDFELLAEDNLIATEFSYIRNIVKQLTDAGLLTELENLDTSAANFNMKDSMLNIAKSISSNLVQIPTGETTKSRIEIITTNLMTSKLLEKVRLVGTGFVDDFVQEQVEEYNADKEESEKISFSKVNSNVIKNLPANATEAQKQEKNSATTQIGKLFKDIFNIINDIDISKFSSDLMGTIMSLDFAKLGVVLDDVQDLSLFKSAEQGEQGFYKDMLTYVDELFFDVSMFADLTPAVADSFNWEQQLGGLQGAIDRLQTVKTRNAFGDGELVSILNYMLACGFSDFRFLAELKTTDTEATTTTPLVKNDIDAIFGPILCCEIVSPIKMMLLNEINRTIGSALASGSGAIEEITDATIITEQKDEILKVLKAIVNFIAVDDVYQDIFSEIYYVDENLTKVTCHRTGVETPIVNGSITLLGYNVTNIHREEDTGYIWLTYNETTCSYNSKYYFMLNKPADYLSLNAEIMGTVLNSVKENKYRENWETKPGVFAETYRVLVDFVKSLSPMADDVISEYENPKNINWVDLIKVVQDLDTSTSANLITSLNTLKTDLQKIVASMHNETGTTGDYYVITGKLIDMAVELLGTDPDYIDIITGTKGISAFNGMNSTKTANVIELFASLTNNADLAKFEEFDITNQDYRAVIITFDTLIDAVNATGATSINKIDALITALNSLDDISTKNGTQTYNNTSVNDVIDFIGQFVENDSLDNIKSLTRFKSSANVLTALKGAQTLADTQNPTAIQSLDALIGVFNGLNAVATQSNREYSATEINETIDMINEIANNDKILKLKTGISNFGISAQVLTSLKSMQQVVDNGELTKTQKLSATVTLFDSFNTIATQNTTRAYSDTEIEETIDFIEEFVTVTQLSNLNSISDFGVSADVLETLNTLQTSIENGESANISTTITAVSTAFNSLDGIAMSSGTYTNTNINETITFIEGFVTAEQLSSLKTLTNFGISADVLDVLNGLQTAIDSGASANATETLSALSNAFDDLDKVATQNTTRTYSKLEINETIEFIEDMGTEVAAKVPQLSKLKSVENFGNEKTNADNISTAITDLNNEVTLDNAKGVVDSLEASPFITDMAADSGVKVTISDNLVKIGVKAYVDTEVTEPDVKTDIYTILGLEG